MGFSRKFRTSLYGGQLRGETTEIQRTTGRVGHRAVRVQPPPLRPEGAQPVPRAGIREPGVPESAGQFAPPVDLQGPGAEVTGDVETGVDIREPGLPRPRDADSFPEHL